jgi:hypothetical protein
MNYECAKIKCDVATGPELCKKLSLEKETAFLHDQFDDFPFNPWFCYLAIVNLLLPIELPLLII